MSADPATEVHHLVSRGYQQNFADQWKRVAIIDVASCQTVEPGRPTKSNFALPGFNSYLTHAGTTSAELEREYAKIERRVLNQIRGIRPPECSPVQTAAVINLFAIHLVRSEAFLASHARILREVADTLASDAEANSQIRQRFSVEFQRPPGPGELRALIDRLAHEQLVTNVAFIDSQARQHNKIGDLLSKFYVQVIVADCAGSGFALGDIPAVHGNTKTEQYGFRDGLALGDANLVIAPLSRYVAACFSKRRLPPVRIRTKKRLDLINSVFLRAALREVACHPDDALMVQQLSRRADRSDLRVLVGD
jgi:hypothetical protein